jgi:hypothetical protein
MNRIQARKTIQARSPFKHADHSSMRIMERQCRARRFSRQRKFASTAAAVIVAHKASQGQYFNLKVSA